MSAPIVTLRPAVPDDAEFVLRVTEACMRAYAEQTWGAWNEALTRASFDPATHRIIQCDEQDIGCLALHEWDDHLDLDKLYILPAYQNRGIGTRLMDDIVAQAAAAGKPVRLSVLAVNPARRFYERAGFVVTQSTAERHYMEWRDL
jgi:ribosomal protein S18 acetylase RimI-like enzyme